MQELIIALATAFTWGIGVAIGAVASLKLATALFGPVNTHISRGDIRVVVEPNTKTESTWPPGKDGMYFAPPPSPPAPPRG